MLGGHFMSCLRFLPWRVNAKAGRPGWCRRLQSAAGSFGRIPCRQLIRRGGVEGLPRCPAEPGAAVSAEWTTFFLVTLAIIAHSASNS